MSLKDINPSSLVTIDLFQNEADKTSEVIETKCEYVFIGNIPDELNSADLRNIFTDFVENSCFDCFHYRHRPETNVVRDERDDVIKDSNSPTCCCVVRILTEYSDRFIEKYNNKQWFSKTGKRFKSKTNLRRLKINEKDNDRTFLSKSEKRSDKHIDDQTLYQHDLKHLIELNPPKQEMPHGNVGTPTAYFLKLISECKMPSSVLKRLQIDFPKKKGHGKHRNVPMEYTDRKGVKFNESNNEASRPTKPLSTDDKKSNDYDSDRACNASNRACSDREDDDAEDWERHEALHDDVDNQARPKERLFEEDIEVKWEKGGSGLVFYTDAQYWNELKGKDFDEDTVDDWDVDYSIYYEDGAGDKPARDQLQMRIEERRRKGLDDVGPIKYSDVKRLERKNKRKMDNFAAFEKYSKGFGSKLLKKQGWREGSGLGAKKDGIAEPVSYEFSSTSQKRTKIGFGYHGEKLNRNVEKSNASREVYIATVYDEKDGPQFDAMRYYGQEILKYRPNKIDFTKEKKS